MGKSFLFRVISIALLFLGFSPTAQATIITMDLGYVFSGDTPAPSDGAPWLRATFDDEGTSGAVTLTLEALNLAAGQYVNSSKGWYLNLDPNFDPAALTFSYVSGVEALSISTGANAFKADGDGRYDINIEFPFPSSGFTSGSTSVYTLSLTGITALSFAFVSYPDGGSGEYYSAAHVKNTPDTDADGSASSWIGANDYQVVPIPAAFWLFTSGLVGLAGLRKKLRK